MEEIKASLPLIESSEDFRCGPVAALVLLTYFGIQSTKKEILNMIKNRKNTTLPQIGKVLRKKGLKVSLTLMRQDLFPQETINRSALISNLKDKFSGKKREYLAELADYTNDQLKFREINKDSVTDALTKRRMLITVVNSRKFTGKDISEEQQHMICISGINEQYIFFSAQREIKIPINEAIEAIHLARIPSLLEVWK